MKRWLTLISLVFPILLIGISASPVHAQTSNKISGTFVKAIYKEVEVDKNTTTKVLSQISLKNSAGKTTTIAIDTNAKLSVDSRPVKIDAFKLGMKVEANVQLRRVKTLSGKTGTASAVIEKNSKAYAGTVSYIARNSKNLTVKLDDGQTKNVFYDVSTSFYKQTRKTDISSLHEGDRVKITFSTYNSTHITSLVIMDGGTQVAGLYKGTIHRIDPINKKVILRDELKYLNWEWYPNTSKSTSSYNYSAKTPIYLDDKLIAHNDLRKYAGHKIYLATVKKFGKEQAERLIIQKDVERTYYEPMQSISLKAKQVRLYDVGTFRYHTGTILIRNGRLVAPDALGAYGTAFIVAAGPATNQYANVIHISNDGFASPTLADHTIFFGKINTVNNYKVSLTNVKKLTDNVWTNRIYLESLSFNNETYTVQDRKSGFITSPLDKFSSGQYGYFYVKGNEVIAAHLISNQETAPGEIVSVGRLDTLSKDHASINVRNVSQWQNGSWVTQGYIRDMDIRQATFIKNGKVIQPEDLKINDRLYITGESTIKGKMIMVD